MVRDKEFVTEITSQAAPAINVMEEEEDPDITFNFKGDNREVIFEERYGPIFEVDPEITFNFRSPQTLLGGAIKESRERNRKKTQLS